MRDGPVVANDVDWLRDIAVRYVAFSEMMALVSENEADGIKARANSIITRLAFAASVTQETTND